LGNGWHSSVGDPFFLPLFFVNCVRSSQFRFLHFSFYNGGPGLCASSSPLFLPFLPSIISSRCKQDLLVIDQQIALGLDSSRSRTSVLCCTRIYPLFFLFPDGDERGSTCCSFCGHCSGGKYTVPLSFLFSSEPSYRLLPFLLMKKTPLDFADRLYGVSSPSPATSLFLTLEESGIFFLDWSAVACADIHPILRGYLFFSFFSFPC